MKKSEVRKEIVDALKEDVATVTFIKKDGTERVMKATLQTEFLPMIDSTKPKVERKVNEDVVAVFDTEAKGFRSFRMDSVVSFFSTRVALPDVKGLIDDECLVRADADDAIAKYPQIKENINDAYAVMIGEIENGKFVDNEVDQFYSTLSKLIESTIKEHILGKTVKEHKT